MKKLTTILLTFLIRACNGQEPKEHCISCFTQEQIDSVILSMFSQNYVNNLNLVHQNELDNCNEIVNIITHANDTLNAAYIQHTDQIANQNSMIENLLNSNTFFGDFDLTIQDTIGYNVEVRSVLENHWYTLIADSTRIHLWLVDGKLELWSGKNSSAELLIRYLLPLRMPE
jgi:hypothetical protein